MSKLLSRKSMSSKKCDPDERKDVGSLLSLPAIVDHYIRFKRSKVNHERGFFVGRPFNEALRDAALCIREGQKRHDHQRRINGQLLKKCHQKLERRFAESPKLKTFSELHNLIEDEIGGEPGIGKLTVYDIATRIGANLGLEPNLVYLHAGTRAGAKHLGLGKGQPTLDPRIPQLKAFRRLKPHEIEDCLCSYADHIEFVTDRQR